MSQKIGVVILTLNEAENVVRCIDSVSSFADDIVVLDSGSNDNTVGIAREKGARVISHTQKGKFLISEQRNFILKSNFLFTEWILFLDADEAVTTALKGSILRHISSSEYDAYSLTPKYLFWGKWLKRTQGYPNWHDRLLRREKCLFSGGVWEHFSPEVRKGYISEPYLHFANSKGFDDWLSRHLRYADNDAQKNLEYIFSDRILFDLGTQRKQILRKLSLRLWPLRPWFRFLHMYFFRLGFLEGWKGLLFCFHYFLYEMIILIKTIEGIRRKKELDL